MFSFRKSTNSNVLPRCPQVPSEQTKACTACLEIQKEKVHLPFPLLPDLKSLGQKCTCHYIFWYRKNEKQLQVERSRIQRENVEIQRVLYIFTLIFKQFYFAVKDQLKPIFYSFFGMYSKMLLVFLTEQCGNNALRFTNHVEIWSNQCFKGSNVQDYTSIFTCATGFYEPITHK